MPWHLEQNNEGCAEGEWAVVKDEDGEVEGCHPTEEDAQSQLDALYAEEPDATEAAAVPETVAAEIPAAESGTGKYVVARGVFDDGPAGMEAQRLVENRVLNGVSIDMGRINVIEEMSDPEDMSTYLARYTQAEIIGLTAVPHPAFANTWIRVVAPGSMEWVAIAGIVGEQTSDQRVFEDIVWRPTPLTFSAMFETQPMHDGALAAGRIDSIERTDTAPEEPSTDPVVDESVDEELAAVAAAGVPSPPSAWFASRLAGPTPLSVDENGRVFGHICTWDQCHLGREDSCVTAPHSAANYAYFLTGEVTTAEGTRVRTGPITVGTGHAPLAMAHRNAAAHYDNSGAAVADVACGEDAFGVWVAGALRPGVSDEQIHALRASAPSGDWRRIAGNMELVAVLAVNMPGFPVLQSMAASGIAQSMILRNEDTASDDCGCGSQALSAEVTDLRAEVTRLTKVCNLVAPDAAQRLAARVRLPRKVTALERVLKTIRDKT